MKYNMTAKVYGCVFFKMLKKYYGEHFPEINIKDYKKPIFEEYKGIISRMPSIDIDGEKNNMVSNLIGAGFFFALAKVLPNMTPEIMNEMTDDCMHSDFMVKLHSGKKKKGVLFSDKTQDNWVRFAERSQHTTNPYDWKYTYKKGVDEYDITFTQCGVLKLATDENMLEYLPCMCHMDYSKYEIQGAKLHRTKTLAKGDECCNFHLERIKEENHKAE